jgi:hypothetical protein
LIALLGLLLVLGAVLGAPSVVAAQTISETFPTNGAITANQNLSWTNFGTLAVSSNAAVATPPGSGFANNRARSETPLPTPTANHYVQASVRFVSPSGIAAAGGVSVRYAAGSNDSITLYLQTTNNGSTYTVSGWRNTNGSDTAQIGSSVVVTNLLATNTLRLEVAGASPATTLTGFLNGTQVWSASGVSEAALDSNTKVGFVIQLSAGAAASSVQVDDLSAGPVVSPPPSCTGASPTWTATPDQASVATCVGNAVAGDTVNVLAGTATWTTTLTINRAITLRGAGIGQTVITDGRVRPNDGAGTILLANVPGGISVFRLTGFTFQTDGVQGITADGTIALSGCSTTTANYRIDNNSFINLRNNVIRTSGSLYGVIDHNTATLFSAHHLANHNNLSWPRDGVNCTGQYGDGSWSAALTPGTIKAHYMETNTVSGLITTSSDIIDADLGSRAVVRYNTLNDLGIASHGTDSAQRNRGNRWLEAYENTMNFSFANNPSGIDSIHWIRGGSGVVFNEHIVIENRPAGLNWVVKHLNLRSNDPGLRYFPPFESSAHPGQFPMCDGTSLWDGNTGGSGCAVGDSTCTKGYRCLDQPGAGTSVDWNDQTNPASPLLPLANNAYEPIYVWNNDINGVIDNCGNQAFSCGSDGVVRSNVSGNCVGGNCDIIYGTARPGYTPLVYPHPLVTGTITVQPPTDPGTPVIGTPTIGPTTTTYPITWSPSLAQPSGTPVPFYLYNGGYTDVAGSGTTPTNSFNLVLANRTVSSDAYFCVQGQDAGGVLSLNQVCTNFTVPAVAPPPSPVRSIQLVWINNGGDGFTIQRKDGHCLVPGIFADLIHVTSALSYTDTASPFPYACYHVRATQLGASDSTDSNDAGSDLPHNAKPARGLRRR